MNMSSKKTLIVLMLFVMIICTGCSNIIKTNQNANDNSTMNNENINEKEENKDERTETIKVEQSEKNNYLYLISDYSDGYVWMKYCDADAKGDTKESLNLRYGCVDKNGNVSFYFDETGISKDPIEFSNGYAYIITNNSKKLFVVDTSGRICQKYSLPDKLDNGRYYTPPNEDSELCILYNDGYQVVQNHHVDFDSNSNTYTIYDGEGKDLYSFNSDGKHEIRAKYLGEGVISFDNGVYFAKSNKWMDEDSIDINIMEPDVVYDDSDRNDVKFKFTYINEYGEIVESSAKSQLTYDGNRARIDCIGLYNNHCLFTAYQKLMIYSFDDDSITELTDEKYLKNINDDTKYYFMDDRIVVSLKGQDNKSYFFVLDYNLNVTSEPKEYSIFIDVSDHRIIKDLKEVYDGNGNLLFEIEDNYVHEVSNSDYAVMGVPVYRDDALVVQTEIDDRFDGFFLASSGFAVLDLDGKKLFDSISLKNTKEIILQ